MDPKTDTSEDGQQLSEEEKTEEPGDKPHMINGRKFYIIGKHQEYLMKSIIKETGLQKVSTVKECDGILVLCTIVSRAGTDIDAALKELNDLPESKPAVFMVLHHTFDPEKIILDSNKYVTRENTLTVDCLFNEDKGLFECERNKKAQQEIEQCIPKKDVKWFPCFYKSN